MRGVLFRNDRQREGKKDPEYQGQMQVDGVEYWLDAWLDTSKKDGRKYFSLKLRPKDEGARRGGGGGGSAPDEDIPFIFDGDRRMPRVL